SGAARRKAVDALDGPLPVVLYEAPHRIAKTLGELAERLGAEREVVLARELSKKFEEVARLTLGATGDWLAASHRQQGEFVIVLAAGEAKPAADGERVLEILLESLPPSDAAKIAARISGVPKGELYRKALSRRK